MSVRFFALLSLVACDPGLVEDGLDGTGDPEYRYVLGHDADRGEDVLGGGHYVLRFDTYREAIDSQNTASSLHPALTGTALVYDAANTGGQTDWPVFASNWWPQTRNGVAWRWTDDDVDYSNRSDVDGLSPAEKYDLLFNPGQTRTVPTVSHWNFEDLAKPEADRAPKHSHPTVTVAGPATEWEMKNHGVYQTDHHPEGWWGHCNGWASYATTEEGGAPERDIRVKLVAGKPQVCTATESGCILFRMADIEALLSELYFSDSASFTGRRCETAGADMARDPQGRPTDVACRDLNAGTFHIAATTLFGKQADHPATGEAGHPAFIIDHTYDYEVWNYPVVSFRVRSATEVTQAQAATLVGGSTYTWNASATKFVRVAATYEMVSDSVGRTELYKQAHTRSVPKDSVDVNYVLELDASGKILGGEWISYGGTHSKALHPDFAWMGIDHQGYYESGDDTGGDADNPYVSYDDVRMLLDCANDPSSCGGSGPVDPTDPGTGSGGTVPDCDGCARTNVPFRYHVGGLFGLVLLARRRRD